MTNLARLDLADKKPEMARKRFESLIESNPKVVDAYVALLISMLQPGSLPRKFAKVLDRGLAANPDPLPLDCLGAR